MVGLFGSVKLDDWYVRIHGIQDMFDGNDGFLLQIGGGYNWFYSDIFSMKFDVFSTYASEDYMEAYFEVDAQDSARSGLRQYTEADAGIKDVGLAINANCHPYENWSFKGTISYKKLLEDAEDSPVVDDEGDASQVHVPAFFNFIDICNEQGLAAGCTLGKLPLSIWNTLS
jgi:outer membrane protein